MGKHDCKTCKNYKETEYDGNFCESLNNIFYYLEETTYKKKKVHKQYIHDIDKTKCNYKPNLLEKLNIRVNNIRFKYHKIFNPELLIKD